jgi:hypothetical protein
MSVTTEVIDNIFDEEIRQLNDLKRMASNPRLVDLMRKIVEASNGTGRMAPQTTPETLRPSVAPRRQIVVKSYHPTGLTAAVHSVVSNLDGGLFTIPSVVKILTESGFNFTAANPKVAVAGPINAFLKRGTIRLVRAGTGSEPNQYEFVGQGNGRLDLDRDQTT